MKVLRLTSEISKQVFPITLDLDNPAFKPGLDRLVGIERAIAQAQARGGVIGAIQRAGLSVAAAATFARLYLIPTQSNALPAEIRLSPVW